MKKWWVRGKKKRSKIHESKWILNHCCGFRMSFSAVLVWKCLPPNGLSFYMRAIPFYVFACENHKFESGDSWNMVGRKHKNCRREVFFCPWDPIKYVAICPKRADLHISLWTQVVGVWRWRHVLFLFPMQNSGSDESDCGFMCCLSFLPYFTIQFWTSEKKISSYYYVLKPHLFHESKAKKAKLVNCSPLFLMNRGKAGQFKDT